MGAEVNLNLAKVAKEFLEDRGCSGRLCVLYIKNLNISTSYYWES